jgi:hypothetical protein
MARWPQAQVTEYYYNFEICGELEIKTASGRQVA